MKYKAKGLQGTWTIDDDGLIREIPWDAWSIFARQRQAKEQQKRVNDSIMAAVASSPAILFGRKK